MGRRGDGDGAAGRRDDDARAFADDVLLLTAWRRLPYLDPGLPVEFLPQDWQGIAAERLFIDPARSGWPVRPGAARPSRHAAVESACTPDGLLRPAQACGTRSRSSGMTATPRISMSASGCHSAVQPMPAMAG